MEKIQSDFKWEEMEIGKEVVDGFTKQKCKILNLTSNSIEMFLTANNKSIKAGKKEDSQTGFDEEEFIKGKLKGINSTGWFTLDQFNRRFIR
ncbi:MAG: hypothetical protein ABIP51_08320 [Bacteroidia bacterium]